MLLHFEPPRSVAYISHFFGITLETRQTFHAVSDAETEVQVRGEFVGIASRAFGFALGPAIERATRLTTEALNKECERVAASQPGPSRVAAGQADASSADAKT